ncbi:MAG: site-specific integrase [Bacteroidales bacterium]
MAKIKFYLKDSKQSETAIYARISYGAAISDTDSKEYINLKYYIAKSINPAFWNPKTNRAKGTKDFPEYPEFNSRLDIIESTINSVFLKLENTNITPNNQLIKKELDKILKPEIVISKEETPKDLFPFIDHLIKTSNNKYSTLKSFKVVRRNLQEYQKAKKTVLNFNSIDIDFYNSFVDFLTKPTKEKNKTGQTITKAGLSKNTIGTRIKILKTFINEANDRGITVLNDYRKKSFKVLKEETSSIYLNESELMKIYYIETSLDSLEILRKEYNTETLPEYLAKVRDLFLIGCYTGLRFSDLSKLNKDNITSDNTINIKTIKTNQSVVVPIHPITRQIFEKYDYQLPRVISNQRFNDYLKHIAKIARINEPITTESTKGGFKVSETTEKYNLVTSHTARRSFATNAFLMDMPSISIMKITGHKTESAFMKYIKMSAKDNAIKMQSHKFFNPMLIAK